jgi:hypothetical protein
MSLTVNVAIPQAAYGLPLADLERDYTLIHSYEGLNHNFTVEAKLKDSKACEDEAKGKLADDKAKAEEASPKVAAGDKGSRELPLSRMVRLAANKHFSKDYPLTTDSKFAIFSRTIVGAETLSSKVKKALKKFAFLHRGASASDSRAIILKQGYWQEALLPTHPYGPDVEDYFGAWSMSKRITCSFEDWINLKAPHLRPSTSVAYLSDAERIEFEVEIHGGKVISHGSPLDSLKYATSSKEPYAIYVISCDNKMYIGPYDTARFHHSSFLSGAPVIGAGQIQTAADGSILVISSKSGHYKPSAMQLLNTFQFLESKGVDLSTVALIENTPGGIRRHSSVTKFITESPKGKSAESF